MTSYVEESNLVRTIPAREIKRRGLSALADELREGPLHIIENDAPSYVVMTEAHYQWLLEMQREAELAGIREALDDAASGQVTAYDDAEDLIQELELGG